MLSPARGIPAISSTETNDRLVLKPTRVRGSLDPGRVHARELDLPGGPVADLSSPDLHAQVHHAQVLPGAQRQHRRERAQAKQRAEMSTYELEPLRAARGRQVLAHRALQLLDGALIMALEALDLGQCRVQLPQQPLAGAARHARLRGLRGTESNQ